MQVFKVLVELSILLFEGMLGVSESHRILSQLLAELQRRQDLA